MELENRYSTRKYISFENGLSLDGIDDYVEFPFSNIGNTFSFSFFFKYIEDTPPTATYIFEYGQLLPTSINLIQCTVLNAGGNERKLFISIKNTISLFIIPDTLLIPERWYHITCTSDGTDILTYINSKLVDTSTTPTALVLDTYRNDVNSILTIGTQNEALDFGNIDIAHLCFFDGVLNQQEIIYIYRYGGIIPKELHDITTFHNTFQKETISNKSFIRTETPFTPISVNQIGHGFSEGDCIYDNLGTWTIADGTNPSLYSNPPTVVNNVVDIDNFEYSQEGLATLDIAVVSSIGSIGDFVYCQSDGSLSIEETGNFIGHIYSDTEILIGSEIFLGIKTNTGQYNYAKSSDYVDYEIIGQIYGKTLAEIGINNTFYPKGIPSDSLSDLYSMENGRVSIPNKRKIYSGSEYDEVLSWNQLERTDNFTFFLDFKLNSTINQYIFEQGDSTAERGIYLYIDGGDFIFEMSNGIGNKLKVSFDCSVGENLLGITYSLANGINIYKEGNIINKTILENTLTSTLISIDTSFTIGGRNNGSSLFSDMELSTFEILDMELTKEEFYQIQYNKSLYSKGYSLSDFLLMVDFTQNDTDSPITFSSTPNYTITSTGSNLYKEGNEIGSNYPYILSGIRLGNTVGNFPYDTYIDLDNTNLPDENNDDYTFYWSGFVSNNPIPASSGYIREHLFLLTPLDNTFWNLSERLNFGLNYKSDNPFTYPVLFGNRFSIGGDVSFIEEDVYTKKLLIKKMSFAVSYNKSKGEWSIFHNGHKQGTDNSITLTDFTSSPIFRINNLTLGSSAGGINGTSIMFSNHIVSSFGYWKRTLGEAEIMHLHNNSNQNNPWEYQPSYYDRKGQENLIIWHSFNKEDIYDDGLNLRIRNHADISGTTDAILNGYPSLAIAKDYIIPSNYIF